MRKVMACLACKGKRLFCKEYHSEVPVEATDGLWDVCQSSENELYYRQKMFDSHAQVIRQAEQDYTPPSVC